MAEGATETCQNPVNLSKQIIMSSLGNKCGYQDDARGQLTNGHANGQEVLENETRYQEENILHLVEDDLKLFEHQVAGHGTQEKGLLKHKNGWVLKPLQPPPKGGREVSFYQEVHQKHQSDQDKCYANLRRFVPSYHGTASLNRKSTNECTSQKNSQHLYLLIVIEGFKKPCVADIKLGAQTWSPDASEAKKNQEDSKYKGTKIPLGICFTGMHYYNARTGEKCKMTRDVGKTLIPSTLKTALETFFNKENSELYRALLSSTIKQLQEIEKVFSIQKAFKLYGSSVLLAYDADFFSNLEKSGNPDSVNGDIPVRVFMIDFAHFHPEIQDDKVDENYLFGLRNLIKILCDIVEPSDQ